MMTSQEIDAALAAGQERTWSGEPFLGGTYGEEEVQAAVEAIRDSCTFEQGFGFSSKPICDFEEAMAKYCGVKYGVAVNSAGPGLDIVMRALHMQPGDEVIIPSVNYDAAPLAVLHGGGTIVWGEVRASDYMLDPADVERKITPRTRAIFPVHIHGMCAPMDEYVAIANRHPHPVYGPPKVIGDAARACGGDYKGTKVGKLGWCTIFSFQTMKNMTTLGEGGMIVTDDEELYNFGRSVRMYGRNLGEYGTSNVMTKVQAAVGLVQLKKLDGFIAARRRVAAARNQMLAGTEGITLPMNGDCSEHTFYLYPLTLSEELGGERRDAICKMLVEEYHIGAWVANLPNYLVHPYVAAHAAGTTPVSEKIVRQNLCLPLHPAMSDRDNRYITAAFLKCLEKCR